MSSLKRQHELGSGVKLIGALGPQDHFIFRDGPALCRLLEQLERDTVLVLAGDIFDFLQIPGYSGFDAALAAERFDRYLLKADRNVQVIAALAVRKKIHRRIAVGAVEGMMVSFSVG